MVQTLCVALPQVVPLYMIRKNLIMPLAITDFFELLKTSICPTWRTKTFRLKWEKGESKPTSAYRSHLSTFITNVRVMLLKTGLKV